MTSKLRNWFGNVLLTITKSNKYKDKITKIFSRAVAFNSKSSGDREHPDLNKRVPFKK